MKKWHAVTALVIAVTLAVGAAPAAQAQWGDPGTAPYCSSSVGCTTGSDGKPVFVRVPGLTAREEGLRLQCYLRLAGAGFTLAGGIASKNLWGYLAAAFQGTAAASGPCTDLWNSTARLR